MNKKYVVRLAPEERQRLERLVSVGRGAARKLTHARVILAADADGPGWPDERIAEGLGVGVRTIENLRQRFVEDGLEAAIERKKHARLSVERKLDGEKEARLTVIACSVPPEGRTRWTLQLLADKLVELAVVDTISRETVRQSLKKVS